MKIYQVGGSVRDELKGCTPMDRDWVVVGETVESMLGAGFVQIGENFTIFLHPETKEEYAMARTSRRPGDSCYDREADFHPAATIEEDLAHRDFTMNAMARASDGTLIDPFGGAGDIANETIRHVGDSFREDPIRVLRGARFCARWPGLTHARETMVLYEEMVEAGELDDLQPERIWQELVKALDTGGSVRFLEVLRIPGALARVLPEIDALFGVPQPEQHHPEIDTGLHIILSLIRAYHLTDDPAVRFAVLVHDLGKGTTPRSEWPHHRGHEERGVKIIEAMTRRLRAPNRFRDLGILAARWHCHVHNAKELRPGTILRILEAADAFKRPERLEELLIACEADARGRKGLEDRDYPQADMLRRALKAAETVTAKTLLEEGHEQSPQLGSLLRQKRIEAIKGQRNKGKNKS